jgi:hypothetical protein
MTFKQVCKEIANDYLDEKYARNFEASVLTAEAFGIRSDEEFLIDGRPPTREEIEEFKRLVLKGCLTALMDAVHNKRELACLPSN